MNLVILKGRLTVDPELRQTTNGTACVRFTLAVERSFKEKDGERKADFISCVAWRNTAEFISRYFNKGNMMLAVGELRTGSYQDKNHSDVTHYTTEAYINSVEFCESKRDNQEQEQPQAEPVKASDISYGSLNDFEEILSDGDVPF